MKAYIEITFLQVTDELKDLIIAELSDIGYDGFLEEEAELKAYIEANQFNEPMVLAYSKRWGISYTKDTVEEQNWNAEWEKSFEPVIIGNQIAIRASFHPPTNTVDKEIVITPKMSFGTGHHATTFLMVQTMLDLSIRDKKVLDFGTGTGILAILAAIKGANSILAIDYDEWCIDNARENFEANGCPQIQLELNDSIPEGSTFDLILANINRHIIIEQANSLINALEKGGILLLSGILTEDREIILKRFQQEFGEPVLEKSERNWMLIRFDRR